MQAEQDRTGHEDWAPRLGGRDKPAYIAIADAIADDVREGRLSPGQRLPPQRALAARIGLDFTTISRGYGEARRRGLVDAHVGQGTFVRVPAQPAAPAPAPVARPALAVRREGARAAFVDMTMNQPPIPDRPELMDRLRRDAAEAVADMDPHCLLRYPDSVGTDSATADKSAGLLWLRDRIPGLTADRLTLCPGTQGALLALLTTLARPGDTVCAEALTYPGFKAVARQLGLTVVGAPMDRDGLDPQALRALFEKHRPKLLYCMPTLHNPTTATMPLERREAVIAVAREFGVCIVEDDIYGRLVTDGPPPLAALAPDMVFHIAGLAKCLSPALRLAYVAAPDARQAMRVTGALRATTLMASPITCAIATRWIAGGAAAALLAAVREEAVERQALAAELLPPGSFAGGPESFHIWLRLPPSWTRGEFATHLRTRGIAAVVGDTFAVGDPVPEALRLCLGAAADVAETRWVLSVVAEALEQIPALAGVII
ncbi:PLP-dependent aminotransferase family protein [Azospirillum doebereinerae]|uniref:aminotransferase-like domain-containing protein n=1 Tax=Azospirillum doebereinerae TaxID=92933 RepID=UPI001EE5DC70|nr:PLP-dependent aminotransferase family protein [Azospirillum doebereinerae]MCG5240694.1 PLP-dependent aminotransferase family protein [Azospirillum doebereinerae]